MGKKGESRIDWGPMVFFLDDLGLAYAERLGSEVKKCYEAYLSPDIKEVQEAVKDIGFGEIPEHMVRRAILYGLQENAPMLVAHLILREICFLGMDVEDKNLYPWPEFLDFVQRVEEQDSPTAFWFFFIRNLAALWGIPAEKFKEYYKTATEVDAQRH